MCILLKTLGQKKNAQNGQYNKYKFFLYVCTYSSDPFCNVFQRDLKIQASHRSVLVGIMLIRPEEWKVVSTQCFFVRYIEFKGWQINFTKI